VGYLERITAIATEKKIVVVQVHTGVRNVRHVNALMESVTVLRGSASVTPVTLGSFAIRFALVMLVVTATGSVIRGNVNVTMGGRGFIATSLPLSAARHEQGSM
jgi:hypothetical protein